MSIPRYLPHYTYDDYIHWEGRWELIQGIPFEMSPQPSIARQRVSQRIAAELARALEGCDHRWALLPVHWKISEDTVVQPDNPVACGEVSGACLDRPPVLIFEVLSPSTEQKDRMVKTELYAEQGVKYTVLVNPETRQAEIVPLQDDHYLLMSSAHTETWQFTLNNRCMEMDFARIWD